MKVIDFKKRLNKQKKLRDPRTENTANDFLASINALEETCKRLEKKYNSRNNVYNLSDYGSSKTAALKGKVWLQGQKLYLHVYHEDFGMQDFLFLFYMEKYQNPRNGQTGSQEGPEPEVAFKEVLSKFLELEKIYGVINIKGCLVLGLGFDIYDTRDEQSRKIVGKKTEK